MKKLLILAAFIPTVAFAQTPKDITLTVTPQEVGIIGNGLGQLPYKEVAPLMQKLQGQIAKQQMPPVPAKKVEPAKKGK